jgi:hypothetical protein
MSYIAYYLPPKPLPRRRIWIRKEGTPNTKTAATRFDSIQDAVAATSHLPLEGYWVEVIPCND